MRLYLYGIIEEPEPRTFAFCGIEGGKVYTVNQQRLAAVVSEVDLEVIDPVRANVRAHTLVQEKLLEEFTVLPMGFGMVTAGKDDVRKMIEKNYQGLTSELTRLAGKVEVELKVFWDPEAMIRELQGGSEELTRLKAKIKVASSAAESQMLLMQAGQIVQRTAMDWKTKYANQIYSALKVLAADSKLNNPLGVKNIMNSSYLVDRVKQSEFQKEVYKLDSQYRGKVNFKYVGPLAPYSFVDLVLEPVK